MKVHFAVCRSNEDEFSVWEVRDARDTDSPLNWNNLGHPADFSAAASRERVAHLIARNKIFITEEGEIIFKNEFRDDESNDDFDDSCARDKINGTISPPKNYQTRKMPKGVAVCSLKGRLIPGNVCYECGWVFAKKSECVAHANEAHAGRTRYPCPVCGSDKISFVRAGDLQEHLLIKHSLTYTNKYDVISGLNEPHAVSQEVYYRAVDTACQEKLICYYCGVSYTNKGRLKYHIKWNHANVENKGFTCYHCGNVYKEKKTIKDHIGATHMFSEYVCRICSRVFKSNRLRKKHRSFHGPGGRWPILTMYTCYFCGAAFEERDACEMHAASAHRRANKMSCPVCSAKFDNPEHLQKHLFKSHSPKVSSYASRYLTTAGDLCASGARKVAVFSRFTCFACGQAFDFRKHCEIHAQSAHGGDMPVACMVCKVRFKRADVLQSHLFNEHMPKVGKQKYKRDGLKRDYKRAFILTKYTCFACGAAFDSKSDCEKHARDFHTESNVFDCPVCKVRFDRADKLQFHLLAVHVPLVEQRRKPPTSAINYQGNGAAAYYVSLPKLEYANMGDQNVEYVAIGDDGVEYACASGDQNVEYVMMGDQEYVAVANKSDGEGDVEEFKMGVAQDAHSFLKEGGEDMIYADENSDTFGVTVAPTLGDLNLLVCLFCDAICMSYEEFLQHLNANHAENLHYSCNYCPLKFDTHQSLSFHCQVKHPNLDPGTNNFFALCDLCEIEFTNELFFRKHLAAHENRFACDDCEGTFDTQAHLDAHVNEAHHDLESYIERLKRKTALSLGYICDGFICHHCQYVSKDKDMLRAHMKKVHLKRQYMCTVCPRIFPNNFRRATHIKNEHGKKRMRVLTKYTCFACGEAFETKELCEQHAQDKHACDTSLVCPVCFVAFKRADTLVTHLFHHSPRIIVRSRRKKGKPPQQHRCNICGLVVTSSNSLSKHLVNRHSTVRKFECPLCKKAFKYLTHARTHLTKVHGRKNKKNNKPGNKQTNLNGICFEEFKRNIIVKYS